jgi:hypothetical protein|tara:strand:- start:18 stop:311 length:294 start_codon:yes stop_codon:yes gene_type:complete
MGLLRGRNNAMTVILPVQTAVLVRAEVLHAEMDLSGLIMRNANLQVPQYAMTAVRGLPAEVEVRLQEPYRVEQSKEEFMIFLISNLILIINMLRMYR